ncbi:MAG: hypothetical protein HYT69_01105 [Candidatus Zambryskibacteria bacterium]|nr:hypothetical protein [Candidatus Zambryskibacteria bacterium]
MKRAAPFRIEWDAHEYEHKERSLDWFWAVWIITFSVAIAAVIFGNIILGILVLTSVFALALFINRPPENVHVIVDERGITRGKIHYPYESLHSYWLDTDHPHPKIILRSQKAFMPLIIVPIGETDALKLDATLAQFLPEKYHAMPFVEKILEYLGF